MYNPYTKAILGAVLAMVTSLVTAVEDGSGFTTGEIATAVLMFFGALSVVWASHLTIKWVMGAVMAAGAAFVTAVQDSGISTQEWLTIAVAGLTALATIYATPNTPRSTAPAVKWPKETPEVVVPPTQ